MGPSLDLSELQLSIMRVLWERREVTAAEVHDALRGERDLAPTTVSTVLSRLEKRGVVGHRTEGRQFIYRALVSEGEVRRSMVSDLGERLFAGDVSAFLSHLLTERDVTPGDLTRMRELIDRMEQGADGAGAEDQTNRGNEDRNDDR